MTPPDKNRCSVVFQTPTSMDRRSFTSFGLHAKPNTNSPLGFFGTGLKNAIAILVRNNIPITIYSGKFRYEFYSRTTKYRGAEVNEIKCKITAISGSRPSKPSYIRLPYTTDLGKTWSLWQAFRELESNTRDEDGETRFYTYTFSPGVSDIDALKQATYIVVGGNEFAQVYHNRAAIFLSNAKRQLKFVDHDAVNSGDSGEPELVEVFDEPSQFLYYRGVRVFDLNQNNWRSDREENPVKSRYTYNFLCRMELTEDRTLRYPFLALSTLGTALIKSRNTDLIESVLSVDGDKFWESKIDFDGLSLGETPTKEFITAFENVQTPLPSARKFIGDYYARITPPPVWEGMSIAETVKYAREYPSPEADVTLDDFMRAVIHHLGE